MKQPDSPNTTREPTPPLDSDSREDAETTRRPYERPKVTEHGRLTDITLGGSPGAGDSGGGFETEFPL